MTDLLPTIPGYAPGIVAINPLTLQCGRCGTCVAIPPTHNIGTGIILSGFAFHTCNGPTGVRLCRECYREVVEACPRRRCKESIR